MVPPSSSDQRQLSRRSLAESFAVTFHCLGDEGNQLPAEHREHTRLITGHEALMVDVSSRGAGLLTTFDQLAVAQQLEFHNPVAAGKPLHAVIRHVRPMLGMQLFGIEVLSDSRARYQRWLQRWVRLSP